MVRCLYTCIYRTRQETCYRWTGDAANRQTKGVCAPLSCMPGTFHGGVKRRCSQSAAGKSRVCNSIKKEVGGTLGRVGGCSMCDGGWGLVCPEAHEAAAADGTLLPRTGDRSVLLVSNWTREAISNARHSRPRPPSHIRNTYFSRTAWTSIPEEFHLQAGANESERGARRGR